MDNNYQQKMKGLFSQVQSLIDEKYESVTENTEIKKLIITPTADTVTAESWNNKSIWFEGNEVGKKILKPNLAGVGFGTLLATVFPFAEEVGFSDGTQGGRLGGVRDQLAIDSFPISDNMPAPFKQYADLISAFSAHNAYVIKTIETINRIEIIQNGNESDEPPDKDDLLMLDQQLKDLDKSKKSLMSFFENQDLFSLETDLDLKDKLIEFFQQLPDKISSFCGRLQTAMEAAVETEKQKIAEKSNNRQIAADTAKKDPASVEAVAIRLIDFLDQSIELERNSTQGSSLALPLGRLKAEVINTNCYGDREEITRIITEVEKKITTKLQNKNEKTNVASDLTHYKKMSYELRFIQITLEMIPAVDNKKKSAEKQLKDFVPDFLKREQASTKKEIKKTNIFQERAMQELKLLIQVTIR